MGRFLPHLFSKLQKSTKPSTMVGIYVKIINYLYQKEWDTTNSSKFILNFLRLGTVQAINVIKCSNTAIEVNRKAFQVAGGCIENHAMDTRINLCLSLLFTHSCFKRFLPHLQSLSLNSSCKNIEIYRIWTNVGFNLLYRYSNIVQLHSTRPRRRVAFQHPSLTSDE